MTAWVWRAWRPWQVAVIVVLTVAGCATSELKKAEHFAAVGDWDEALAAYREVQRKDPFDLTLTRRVQEMKQRAAERHYETGQTQLKENHIAEALREFNLAVTLEPARREYHAAYGDALRMKEAAVHTQNAQKLETLGRWEDAMEAYQRAVQLNPGLTHALDRITKLSERTRADRVLGGFGRPVTLRFQNAKLKEVFEVLARAGNINVVFDRDVKDDPITIFIKDAPFPEALNLILTTNNLFSKRIGPDTLLVVPNTKPKQDQYEDQLVRTFYLSNAKATDLAKLLKTMLDSKRLFVNEQINAIVIRDQPEKVRIAERIILANDRRDAEVEFDVEVLEVTHTSMTNLGPSWAQQASMGVVPPGFTGTLSASTSQWSFQQLKQIDQNSYLFSLPTAVVINFLKTQSDIKTLAAPKLRVINGKSASVNIGDKQPILLSTTNVLPGQAATGAVPTTSTVTSIEFKDTGVKLTVEPTIHLIDELTMKLKIEVTKLGNQVTLQANPPITQFVFSTRMAETTLNLKDGESVVLAGLLQDVETNTRTGTWGLIDIPIIGKWLSANQHDKTTTEVILTLTPHIVRNLTTPSLDAQRFWSGTELTYSTTPLFSDVVHRAATPPTRTLAAPVLPAAGGSPAGPSMESATRLTEPGGLFRSPRRWLHSGTP